MGRSCAGLGPPRPGRRRHRNATPGGRSARRKQGRRRRSHILRRADHPHRSMNAPQGPLTTDPCHDPDDASTRIPAQPPRRARGGIRLHHARGRRRVRAHRCCCSRAARIPSSCCASPRRPSARRASRSRSCTSTPATTSPRSSTSATGAWPSSASGSSCASVQESIDTGRVREEPGNAVAQPAADDDPAGRHHRARVRRGLRRRAARRGEGPRQGARLLAPRRVRPVGAAQPAPRAVGPLQRPHPPRPAHARLPDLQLDRDGRLAVHRARGRRGARRSTSPTSATSSGATACGWPTGPFLPLSPTRSRSSAWSCATGRSAT